MSETESSDCSKFFITAKCKNGHKFHKRIFCGKEWCPICGKDGSPAHKRRVARWYRKAIKFGSIGYMIVTFPASIRNKFWDPKLLKAKRKEIIKMLKSWGYAYGLIRLHWFGDSMDYENCMIYHPHFNIFIDEKRIKPKKLELIKKEIANILDIRFDQVNLFYRYYTSPKKKYHKLKYVLRATFLVKSWNEDLANNLKYFRNCVSWGSKKLWDSLPVMWTLRDSERWNDDGASLFEGYCPLCGNKIKWNKQITLINNFEKIYSFNDDLEIYYDSG